MHLRHSFARVRTASANRPTLLRQGIPRHGLALRKACKSNYIGCIRCFCVSRILCAGCFCVRNDSSVSIRDLWRCLIHSSESHPHRKAIPTLDSGSLDESGACRSLCGNINAAKSTRRYRGKEVDFSIFHPWMDGRQAALRHGRKL